jgi:hypothetical protein
MTKNIHTIIFKGSLKNQRISRACIVHLVIKKTNWFYVKTMSCSGSHLGITINIKNTKFVKDLPMMDNIFFSEAIALIEPKLCIHHWKVLYKLCVFYVDRNSKMTTTAGHSFYIGSSFSFVFYNIIYIEKSITCIKYIDINMLVVGHYA